MMSYEYEPERDGNVESLRNACSDFQQTLRDFRLSGFCNALLCPLLLIGFFLKSYRLEPAYPILGLIAFALLGAFAGGLSYLFSPIICTLEKIGTSKNARKITKIVCVLVYLAALAVMLFVW